MKSVPCRSLKETGFISNGLYVLGTEYDRNCGTYSYDYEFYNSNGEKAFDKSFASAKGFDKNGHAIVSDDKINYYLIDNKGNQISGLYSSIALADNCYIVSKNGKKGLLNKNGEEFVPCEYSRIDILTRKNVQYASLREANSKYSVYDIEKNKELLSSDSKIDLQEHYMQTEANNKKQYYSYTTGKMFYEK